MREIGNRAMDDPASLSIKLKDVLGRYPGQDPSSSIGRGGLLSGS